MPPTWYCYQMANGFAPSASRRLSMVSAVSDRFAQMRGGGAGGPIGHAAIRLAAIVAGLIVVLVLLPTTVTYIHPGHVGIVISRTGGGVERIPLDAGPHTRNPLTN